MNSAASDHRCGTLPRLLEILTKLRRHASDTLTFWTYSEDTGRSMGCRHVLLKSGWLVLSLLIVGCASTPAPAPAAAVSTEAKAPESNYIIGPGDSLEVFVWRNPELSVTVPVRPDG